MRDARVQDAFRLAHSFKGGARVCDLREAEQLGHGLEAMLEGLHRGELPLTESVFDSLNSVLDAIEDWMAALEDDLPLPDTSEVLTAIDRVLSDGGVPEAPTSKLDARAAQLRSVFEQEYLQHSARLRELVGRWNDSGEAVSSDELREATRAAHTLAGAAAIVGLPAIETTARSLEELMRAVQAGQQTLDADARRQVGQGLDAMSDAMRNAHEESGRFEHSSDGNERDTARNAPASKTDAPSTNSLHSASTCESVRVSVDSLDRLVRSSSQMLADNQRMSRLSHQVASLQLEVNELDRERESLRRSARRTFTSCQ